LNLLNKKSFFNSFVFFLNAFNSILILICVLLYNYYLPGLSTFSFLTFFFPIFTLFNLIFLIYWILNFNLKLILSLTIFLILNHYSISFYNLNDSNIDSNGLHVMSYNVRLFNHYKWIDSDSVPEKIKKFIVKENPDLLAVQEYHNKYKRVFKNFKNKHVILSGNNVGKAIYTNNKLINKGTVDLQDFGNVAIFIDFLQNKDTIRLYNAHFESFKVDLIALKADVESIKEVIFKTKKAYLVQETQSSALIQHMLQSPYPVVLAADLNNTQHSFFYKQFKNNFNDSFISNGAGFGSTYDFKFMPIRIDYLFNSKSINVNNFKVYSNILSDHMPISVFLNI
jgi:vancomycin resistance protein VanJ